MFAPVRYPPHVSAGVHVCCVTDTQLDENEGQRGTEAHVCERECNGKGEPADSQHIFVD